MDTTNWRVEVVLGLLARQDQAEQLVEEQGARGVRIDENEKRTWVVFFITSPDSLTAVEEATRRVAQVLPDADLAGKNMQSKVEPTADWLARQRPVPAVKRRRPAAT